MARRFAKAAITRELSRSDMKPVKGKMLGKMSTVTVGNLDARRRRFVRVKRKGGEVDFLVDHRKNTVSCVVHGNVIELACVKRRKTRAPSTRVRAKRSSPRPSPLNWGRFGQRIGYLLALTLLVFGISESLKGAQGLFDAFGNNIDKAGALVKEIMKEGNVGLGHAKDTLDVTLYNVNVAAKNWQEYKVKEQVVDLIGNFAYPLLAFFGSLRAQGVIM